MLHSIPDKIHFDQEHLFITWKDGRECSWKLLELRRACPCATCRGGHSADSIPITGSIQSIKLSDYSKVGRYALRLVWSDGHDSGVYTFDRLRESCDQGSAF
ncbi:MAG: DUF971 domain-containing protein [Leptospiraceae bacterium]|nr:DUF971 domain-containing protein [Leptospiraceae bacterium]